MGKQDSRPTQGAFARAATFSHGRDMLLGSIGYHADCAADPYDLRPAADLILRAIDDRRAAVGPDRKIAVLMGEFHSCAAHHDSGVILQMTGENHVLGHRTGNHSFANSLYARFNAAGASVIPVFVTRNRYAITGLPKIPGESIAALKEGVVIDGLDDGVFIRLFSDTPTLHERAAIRKLHAASGNTLTFYPVESSRPQYFAKFQTALQDAIKTGAIQPPKR